MRNLLSKLKEKAGFTLAELVVTTAVMGTLAAVAVPKFSDINEMAKARKTMSIVDNILSAAVNYYNEQTVMMGRGKFPGQTKFNRDYPDSPDSTNAAVVFENTQFLEAYGGQTVLSPYEDGEYMFYVLKGGGTGDAARSPTIVVFDAESFRDYSKAITP